MPEGVLVSARRISVVVLCCWLVGISPGPAAEPSGRDVKAQVLAIYEEYRQEFPEVAEISAEEVLRD